jgi:hypothetical protein
MRSRLFIILKKASFYPAKHVLKSHELIHIVIQNIDKLRRVVDSEIIHFLSSGS